MFCDTHCHILSEYYDDINAILEESKEAGVSRVINAGYNYESSKEVIELVKKYPEMYGVVGLHPENISEDFDYTIFDNLDLPVVIHSRDAAGDTLEILKRHHNFGVIHSFSGSLEMAKEYIKLGFVLGVNGVVTFKNCNLGDTLKNIDINSIILETDSPYLTPVPFRGIQNNPGKMINTAKFVADIYGVSLEELAKITNQNIKRIFDI